MSIATEAVHALLGGASPASVWATAKAKIEQWTAGINAKVPASVQPIVAAAEADVKQFASDIGGAAGTALPAILSGAGSVIDDLFAKAATTYLGPAVGPTISAAEADAMNEIESWLIGHVKAAKLTQLAAITGASAAPPPPGN